MLLTLGGICLCSGAAAPLAPAIVTLSIVGTTDLHGYVFARDGRGGLALFGGYLENLRAARAADGGAMLLIDTGDTYLGGIESNLSEGAIVVDAYNALGYTAAAIGNHEFDFGPADASGARQMLGHDPRGALKARAAQASFPFLAANLIDDASGRPVDWPNVRPSVIVEAAGVRVGIVGVMTIDALRATLRANVQGLRTAPLAPAIAEEAAKLRAAGADLVVVGSHAGGACAEFSDASDLSSCDASSEIFEVARSLPAGLIDAIVAGHTHQAVAHEVAGVAIVQGYAHGRAFGRVDVAFDRRNRRVVSETTFPPRDICERQDPVTLSCEPRPETGALPLAVYEGAPVAASPAVTEAMAPALARVRALQATKLGIELQTPFARSGNGESPLGNLFADALRASSRADIAFNNNSRGGLRADLPEGALTLGALYDVFPFDNRVLEVRISGADLGDLLTEEVRRDRRGVIAISGARVRVSCSPSGLTVEALRTSGEPIRPDEKLTVAAMDSLVLGPLFAPIRRGEVPRVSEDAPVMRALVEDWLRRRGGRLGVEELVDVSSRRWDYESDAAGCIGLRNDRAGVTP
jgi:2',3'-cyclic-nucleotide 2'-phosphodiesterase (5'-nucleotidase family)